MAESWLMKKKQFSVEQMIRALRQVQAGGVPAVIVAYRHAITLNLHVSGAHFASGRALILVW